MNSIGDIINGLWLALLLIGGGSMLISTQYDNYRISEDIELTTFNIKDIEKNGIGTSRYIQIEDAIATGDYVKKYYEDTGSILKVIYPVCSMDKAIKIKNGETREQVSVIIIDNTPPKTIIDMNRTTIIGTALVGLDELKKSTTDLLKSFYFKQNLIVLELDSTPEDKEFSILFLLLGIFLFIIGLFAIYGAFISNEDK